MRVMYIASNPLELADLELPREITELQQKFADAGSDPVIFTFQPDLKVEQLPLQLAHFEPDVLHITVHGEKDVLHLSSNENETVNLTAEMLYAFLPILRPPRVIYLNACNSMSIAETLATEFGVPVAIGTSAPIKNWVARASARNFYERLFSGMTVEQAFGTCQQMARALSRGSVDMKMYCGTGSYPPGKEVLRRKPLLVADFADGGRLNGRYFILGVDGCTPDTTQVVFFTDDESYVPDDPNDKENELCTVVRGKVVDGKLWTEDDEPWWADGDVQLYAVAVTGSGMCYTVTSFLSDAIEYRYRSTVGTVPNQVAEAIQRLRENSGAKAKPSYPPPERKQSPKGNKTSVTKAKK
jgi:CHAT domain